MSLNESHVEEAALTWFEELGYAVAHGPHIAPGELSSERGSFADLVLIGRLRDAISHLNPTIPDEAREEALRNGVEVEYKRPDGSIAGDHVRLVDFADPQANDWLAVNQFTVIEAQHNRRPDIVVLINGLPRRDRRRSISSVHTYNYRNYGTVPAVPKQARPTSKPCLQVHSDRRSA